MTEPQLLIRNVRRIQDIKIGDTYALSIAIDDELVARFAELTGDHNPLHMDETFAKSTPFRGRVVHGMLLGSFVSTIIGMHLPGPGALWLSQSYEFISPVRIGDKISLQAEVVRKSEAHGVIIIAIEAKNHTGSLVLKGQGTVKILEEEKRMEAKLVKDCKILVTGGSRGLGATIALKFAQNGAHVFLNCRNSREKALEIQRKADGFEGTIELAQGDVTTEEGVVSVLNQIAGQIVDVLVLNAISDFKQAAFLDQTLNDFERALDYGVRSPFWMLQRLLPSMIAQKFGRIISVLSTSISGVPPKGYSSYNVNKKSLEAITKSIAIEYGNHNICANMISPSMLRTDLMADVPERVKQVLEAQTPLRRLSTLEEIADCVVFLASPQSSYLNGHNMILSGGSTIM
jgi:3-oxoacyl-[acyl-carrier protein] reductase